MREGLAERLLVRVMGWTEEDVARERSELQALATFKYDDYQQFSPGMRFIESLALWLNQFEVGEERNVAYNLVRSKLLFISAAEMNHLVASAFPDVIRPFLIRQVSLVLNVPIWKVAHLLARQEYSVLLRQTLFLGLSDGARTDVLRRANPYLSNEQIWTTYELSERKQTDLLEKLGEDLDRLLEHKASEAEKRFRVVMLLDDFSGSGISYFRREIEDGREVYNGKIAKILHWIQSGTLQNLVAPDGVHIGIVLYAATEAALDYLQNALDAWLIEHRSNITYSLLPVQRLACGLTTSIESDVDLDALLRNHVDRSIINASWRKGRHENPHLGFDECALPLILSHNTPNNTLPLLWFEENRTYRGLFPRVSRH